MKKEINMDKKLQCGYEHDTTQVDDNDCATCTKSQIFVNEDTKQAYLICVAQGEIIHEI